MLLKRPQPTLNSRKPLQPKLLKQKQPTQPTLMKPSKRQLMHQTVLPALQHLPSSQM